MANNLENNLENTPAETATAPKVVDGLSAELAMYADENARAFYRDAAHLEVTSSDEGLDCMIDGKACPLLDGPFTLSVVQDAHVSRDAKFRKRGGELYLDGAEVFSDMRKLIPICVAREGRVMFPAYRGAGSEDNKPLCRSRNGIFPVLLEGGLPFSEACSVLRDTGNGIVREVVCPKARWNDGRKPECQDFYDVAFLDITNAESPFPVIMTLKGAAVSAWNAYKREFAKSRRACRAFGKSISDFYIELGSEDHGNYYTPRFTMKRAETPDESPAKFLPLAVWYRDNLFRRMFEASMRREAPAVTDRDRREALDVTSGIDASAATLDGGSEAGEIDFR